MTPSALTPMLCAAALLAACGLPESTAPSDGSNASCATCHGAIAERFSLSRHAMADRSPVYAALRATGSDEVRAFCDSCHSPRGKPANDTAVNTPSNISGDTLPESGVGCVTCHEARANQGTSNAQLLPTDGNTELGPYADARPSTAHASAQAGFTTSSALCGTCHEVSGPGAFVETPYTEWQSSPARANGITCANCHMSPAPGGPAAFFENTLTDDAEGPLRVVGDHAFVGVQGNGAASLLANAASIAVTKISADNSTTTPTGDTSNDRQLTVTVTNNNPGHSLPSGARFARAMWIEITVLDSGGNYRVISGALDTRGLPVAGDTERVELGDALAHGGVHVDNPLDSDPPLVRALPAAASRALTYRIPTFISGVTYKSVRARVLFRPYAMSLVTALGLDAAAIDNPITVLAEDMAPL